MTERADAVIIGAGAFGASIAYHLAKAGVGRTVLIDSGEVAGQTSGRAAGLTGQLRGTDVMTQLATLSMSRLENFTEETGEPLVYYRSGSLKIARTPRHVDQLEQEVERARRHRLDIGFVSPAQARCLHPFLETTGILAATFAAAEVYLDPPQLPQGYARAAKRLQAEIWRSTVIRLDRNGSGWQVTTTDRIIQAPVVVDAAGAWAASVAAMAGARVPLIPTRHQLLITEAVEGVHPELPIVRIIDANVYVRPELGGFMVGGYEETPLQYPMHLAASFDISQVPLDEDVLRRLIERITPQLPVLSRLSTDLRVKILRGGLPTMTPDGLPVFGPIPGATGLFIASGCCVGGFSISPAAGVVLAKWIVSGEPPFDLSALSPERFVSSGWSEAEVKSRARDRYAYHYSGH